MTLSNLADWVGYAPADLQFVVRIVVAGLLGGIIGWQRQRKGSPAGYRTHCMITVAAAAFTSIAVDQFPTDTGRVIQGILTGIGFMGSGIIWQAGNDIRGLTTAAGVWSVTAVGIMIGTGEYFLGLALFVVIFIILVLPKGPECGHGSRDNEAVAPETTDKSVYKDRLMRISGRISRGLLIPRAESTTALVATTIGIRSQIGVSPVKILPFRETT